MRQILLILFAFLSLYVTGQNAPLKAPLINDRDIKINSRIDTSLKVMYENKSESELKPAYYLNGTFVNSSIIRTLNPKVITGIRVENKVIEIDSKKYHGQLFIETKKNYQFNFISLTDLKLMYSKIKDVPTIFMIDNELINEDYDKFIIDQNYLLRINIETIENSKEGLRFNLIRILTKTQENIKKVNEIRIRGDASLTSELK